jgi:hypothetical protein
LPGCHRSATVDRDQREISGCLAHGLMRTASAVPTLWTMTPTSAGTAVGRHFDAGQD